MIAEDRRQRFCSIDEVGIYIPTDGSPARRMDGQPLTERQKQEVEETLVELRQKGVIPANG